MRLHLGFVYSCFSNSSDLFPIGIPSFKLAPFPQVRGRFAPLVEQDDAVHNLFLLYNPYFIRGYP